MFLLTKTEIKNAFSVGSYLNSRSILLLCPIVDEDIITRATLGFSGGRRKPAKVPRIEMWRLEEHQ